MRFQFLTIQIVFVGMTAAKEKYRLSDVHTLAAQCGSLIDKAAQWRKSGARPDQGITGRLESAGKRNVLPVSLTSTRSDWPSAVRRNVVTTQSFARVPWVQKVMHAH